MSSRLSDVPAVIKDSSPKILKLMKVISIFVFTLKQLFMAYVAAFSRPICSPSFFHILMVPSIDAVAMKPE